MIMQIHATGACSATHSLVDTGARSDTPAAILSLIGAAATSVSSSYVAWRRHRRDIEALSSMDDRMLADIGLSRSDIERSVMCGRR